MALTMTRTRTQTTLTRLATQLARVNGELERLHGTPWADFRTSGGVAIQREVLERQREALVLTLQQFDPSLDLAAVGVCGSCKAQPHSGPGRRPIG